MWVLVLGQNAPVSSISAHPKGDTVDGSEIRRSPVEVGSLPHYLQIFIHPMLLAGFRNHQQYVFFGGMIFFMTQRIISC